jgi:hypothetical protein
VNGNRQRVLDSVRRLYTDWSDPVPQESVIDYPWYRPVRAWIQEHDLAHLVIAAIKALHTAIFALIMGFIVHFAYTGLRGRASRLMMITFSLTIIEGLVLMVNRGRCPLTIVVEDLGDEHGSVSDIYLPGIVARHIPHISTGLLAAGLSGLIVRAGIRAFMR